MPKRAIVIIGIIGSMASIAGLFFSQAPNEIREKNVNIIGSNIINDQHNTVNLHVDSKNNREGKSDIPRIYGISYHEARSKIIESGWLPLSQHWLEWDEIKKHGNGGVFIENYQYYELSSCSGTGYAFCRFEFYDPSGRKLSVITQGEEVLEEKDFGPAHATVSRVFLEEN